MDSNPSFRPALTAGLFGLPPGLPEHPVARLGLVVDIANRTPQPLAYRCYSARQPDRCPLFVGEVAPQGRVRIERLAGESSPMPHNLVIEAQPAGHRIAIAVLQTTLFLLAMTVFATGAHAERVLPDVTTARSAAPAIVPRTDPVPGRPGAQLGRPRIDWPVAMRCPRDALRAKTRICGGTALA
ncbi:hypothetical protein SCH01S_03_00730 [Sphingomonas changbaiensis NBRC 104936]|uniref:Uncharacterized protein n=1 Tax=Sphingomonas changbaiensis NBRC 104936 TaxID=1219043 RepID=A0A0E9MKR2_9SPHN|nr:hypothetical protein [Sphingomonas changbaiensis]GAO38098.1 hypothetical protein SCH01S_03_00730 [Sphingomonas changbaiensis NBRC 104936]